MQIMKPSRLPTVALLLSIVAGPGLVAGQNVPKRPDLDPGMDTNSALAYYRYGTRVVQKDPRRAGDAFYWASQLDPTWAQPLYARRIALLLADAGPFVIGYLDGDKGTVHSKKGARMDSLELRARMLDPFLNRDLDAELLRRYVMAEYEAAQRGSGGVNATEAATFSYFMDAYWRTEAPAYLRAILARSEGRPIDALNFYQRALSDEKWATAEIHLARGHVFYSLGTNDSARAEMQLGLDILRKRDTKDLVYLYESKGVLEHSIGLIDEREGQIEQAREAYSRALQEDLSYYPAHIRLAVLALAEGDSTTAMSEMDLATQIKDDDPWVHTVYASVLTEVGHLGDAEQQLRRVIALAPYYAAPYYALGRVDELAHKPADAVQSYRAFLAHAPAQDARAGEVRQRLSVLQSAASTSPR